jgi:hypothetical protein
VVPRPSADILTRPLQIPEINRDELRVILEGLGMKRCLLETGTPLFSHDDAVRMDEATRKRFGIRLATQEQLTQAQEVLGLIMKLQRVLEIPPSRVSQGLFKT